MESLSPVRLLHAVHRCSVAICHHNMVGSTRGCRFESCSDQINPATFLLFVVFDAMLQLVLAVFSTLASNTHFKLPATRFSPTAIQRNLKRTSAIDDNSTGSAQLPMRHTLHERRSCVLAIHIVSLGTQSLSFGSACSGFETTPYRERLLAAVTASPNRESASSAVRMLRRHYHTNGPRASSSRCNTLRALLETATTQTRCYPYDRSRSIQTHARQV